jgi:hypothetical protein
MIFVVDILFFASGGKMKKYVLSAVVVLVLASLACTLGGSLPGGGSQSTDVLFKDDFSDTSSGWDSVNDADGITDYADGVYRIQVNKTQFDFWANPGLTTLPGDVRVEVDATKSDGPDQNDIGVICRYNKTDTNFTFYYFYISSDGYAGIGKIINNEQSYLTDELAEPHAAIKTGNAQNRITAECVGTSLTLKVNGQQILTTTDDSITSGDVGLIAGTFDTAGTDVFFDNFQVTKP